MKNTLVFALLLLLLSTCKDDDNNAPVDLIDASLGTYESDKTWEYNFGTGEKELGGRDFGTITISRHGDKMIIKELASGIEIVGDSIQGGNDNGFLHFDFAIKKQEVIIRDVKVSIEGTPWIGWYYSGYWNRKNGKSQLFIQYHYTLRDTTHYVNIAAETL